MEKNTMGFEYIDLDGHDITETYRPRPASAPMEKYVARIGEGEDVQVYRLITRTKRHRFPPEREFVTRKSDGKNLAVVVNSGEVVDSLKGHHGGLVGPGFCSEGRHVPQAPNSDGEFYKELDN